MYKIINFIKNWLGLKTKETLYVYVDLLLTKTDGSRFDWIDEDIVATNMSKAIRASSGDGAVFIQSLYSYIYERGGISWVGIKVGGSVIDFTRPDEMSYNNLYASVDQAITSNVSLIRFDYKE